MHLLKKSKVIHEKSKEFPEKSKEIHDVVPDSSLIITAAIGAFQGHYLIGKWYNSCQKTRYRVLCLLWNLWR